MYTSVCLCLSGHLSAAEQQSQIIQCSKALASEVGWDRCWLSLFAQQFTLQAGDFSLNPLISEERKTTLVSMFKILTVTYAKISSKMVNPRDIAGKAEEEEDTRLIDLDLHSRSQGHEDAKAYTMVDDVRMTAAKSLVNIANEDRLNICFSCFIMTYNAQSQWLQPL